MKKGMYAPYETSYLQVCDGLEIFKCTFRNHCNVISMKRAETECGNDALETTLDGTLIATAERQ
jgi:hypothetical protein